MNKDQIKEAALNKLDKAVKAELKNLRDTNEPLTNFHLDSTLWNFSSEELKEVQRNIDEINCCNFRLEQYCRNRSISIN
ncbi:MAG: hypothetical protein K5778_00675 [Bacteroidaceae bacterium]|nr:hypothetical protein [Bacteroidaceae bacterium]